MQVSSYRLYTGFRKANSSHLNLSLLNKELTDRLYLIYFTNISCQYTTIQISPSWFVLVLCYLAAVFLSWCWKSDKCWLYEGLTASLLPFPKSKPLRTAVAKAFECIVVCGWSWVPASFLQSLSTPAPVGFWSHCQRIATAVRAWVCFTLFPSPQGRVPGSVCHPQNSYEFVSSTKSKCVLWAR